MVTESLDFPVKSMEPGCLNVAVTIKKSLRCLVRIMSRSVMFKESFLAVVVMTLVSITCP